MAGSQSSCGYGSRREIVEIAVSPDRKFGAHRSCDFTDPTGGNWSQVTRGGGLSLSFLSLLVFACASGVTGCIGPSEPITQAEYRRAANGIASRIHIKFIVGPPV